MYDHFGNLRHELTAAASDAGLVVFDGTPDLKDIPAVTWHGDWQTFIALARQSRATLLYVQEWKYNPDGMIEETVSQQLVRPFDDEDDEEEEYARFDPVDEENEWLAEHLREALAPWQAYAGFPMSLECIWIKDGVAHEWQDVPGWALEQREAFQAALRTAQHVDRRDRIHLSQETAQKLHAYAYILAIHPRFPEAKSEEKRTFMAERLFGEEMRKEESIHQLFPHSIARRAFLIYWWEIEPDERATVEERARELHRNGVSIRNIAATLHISDAKVRAAINSTDH